MKNFTTYEDFLPEIKSQKTLVLSTDYGRVDFETPFLNRVVLNRMKSEGLVTVESAGPGLKKVTWSR